MPGNSIGQIGLDLVVNQGNFQKQMSGITGLAKKAGAALAAAFATKQLISFGKECLELGSDLAEVQNVVDVTFPAMTSQVDKFAKSAAASFGLSETMAKQYTGTFGSMAKAFGFTEQQAYDMSMSLTGLAGDVASFYNLSQDEAYTKLKSVFTGETESLKDLGVVMTQTALDSYALANGFGKTTSAMSEAEKVALRYQFVSGQLAAAQGDFARTSGGWANQVRILSLQFDSLKAAIGQGLINIFTPVIKIVNTLIGKLSVLANAFKSFTELITGNKSSGVGDVASDAQAASAGLGDAADSAGDLAENTSAAEDAAKKAAKALMGFDKINKLNDGADSGTSSTDIPVTGGAVDYGKLAEGETVVDRLNSKFAKMFEDIQKLAAPTTEAIRNLWDNGLKKLGEFTWGTIKDFWENFLQPMGEWMLSDNSGLPRFFNIVNDILVKIDWDRLKESLSDFYDSLQDVAKFRWNTLMDFYESFLEPMAVWTFSEALPRLIDCFTSFNNNVDWENLRNSLNGVYEAVEKFAENIGEGLLWFIENVLTPLTTWTVNEAVPRFLDTLSIAIETLNSILEALNPLFQWLWDTVLKPLAEWTGELFLAAWDSINDALSAFSQWCEDNPEVIASIAAAVGSFFAAWKVTELLSFIQQSGGVIAVLNSIKTALFGVTAAKIADKAETIYLNALYAKDFVVSVAQSVASLARQAAQFAISTAAKIADTAAQIAMTAATAAWNVVCAIATAATTAFGAAVAFLTSPIGIATAAITAIIAVGVLLYKNWDKVKAKAEELCEKISDTFGEIKESVSNTFGGIWDTVKGVVNSVLGGIESMVNGVIDGVNCITNAFNNMSIDIPEWVPGLGGKTFGFNLPTFNHVDLPRLAQGGFVEKNTPQLAMIGDNRHQGEVVAPEDKLQEMVDAAVGSVRPGITREEMDAIMNNAVMRLIAALSSVGFNLDGEQVATLQRVAQTGIDRRYNTVNMTV